MDHDGFFRLVGDLLVAALPGCIKAFRGKEAWELRRLPSLVRDLSLDAAGRYVASAWEDGTVAVDAVDGSHRWRCQLQVHCIAICPRYVTGEHCGLRMICSGGEDGRVLLSRRGRLETRHSVLHGGEGAVSAVKWQGSLVAWANQKGVKIVDVETQQKVGFIPRQTGSGRLCWLGDDALLIGWDQEVLLAGLRRRHGLHFASLRRRVAVPGELVAQFAQLDAALAPQPEALCAALAQWPPDAKPTAALMAKLQQALGAGDCDEGASWDPQGDEPEEQAAEVLASLHEAQGHPLVAARFLARAGSGRVFTLLSRQLREGRLPEAADGLCRLLALDPARATQLAARHPEVFKPDAVLSALAPLGDCWELRYLRLLSESSELVPQRVLQLTADLQPHRLGPVLEQLLQRKELPREVLEEVLEVSWAKGALDASAMALEALGQTREAFELLLQLSVSRAVRLAEALSQQLLKLALQDAHVCGSVLELHLQGAPLPFKAKEIFHRLPPGFQVPAMGVKALGTLQLAESAPGPSAGMMVAFTQMPAFDFEDGENMNPNAGRQTPICHRRPLQRLNFNSMALSPTKRRKQSHAEESPQKMAKEEGRKSPRREDHSNFNLVLLEVFRRMSSSDIVSKVAPVCKQWREVAQSQELWALARPHLRLVDQFVVLEKVVERRSKGRIFKCKRLGSGETVLLRMVDLELTNAGRDDGLPTSFLREAALLSELRHPNVIRHFGAEILDKRAVMVTEFVHENWSNWFKRLESTMRCQRVADMRDKFKQMLTGLQFLHFQGLMHRNLKPDNLFIDQAGCVKIGDFTTSRLLDIPFQAYTPEDPKERDRSGREMRRLWYRSPEMILREEIYGPKVDTWSVGALFIEASTGKAIFQSDSEIDHLFKVFRVVGTPDLLSWPEVVTFKNFSPKFPVYQRFDLAQVTRACLNSEEDQRALMQQAQTDRKDILQHLIQAASCVGQEGMMLVDRLVTVPPLARANCEEALNAPFFTGRTAGVEHWLQRGRQRGESPEPRTRAVHMDETPPAVQRSAVEVPPMSIPANLVPPQMVWNMLNVMTQQEKRAQGSISLPPGFDGYTRAAHVDFVVQMATALSLRDNTAHLACAVLDKVLSQQDRPVPEEQLKVVAATCLKVSDVFAEQSKEYYKQENSVEYAEAAAGHSITPLQILSCEKEMLPKIDFKLQQPTICWFMQCYLAYARLSMRDAVGKTASFIADLMLLDFDLLLYAPSLKAQCAVLMAAFLVQHEAKPRQPLDEKEPNATTERCSKLGALQGDILCLEYWDSHVRNSVCRGNLAVDASMCLQAVVRTLGDRRREWKALKLNAVENKHVQRARALAYPDSFPVSKLVRYIVPDNQRALIP
ncbi:unnamed protein product [Effrenium voratum]|uniref:Cyclin-dependent kinase 2 homolog n=1 Tax=Effrenium voratum TaxID=2562239 RepID=A0AA36I0V6_9DINO|nr:unnamed protein product [Effrenium voratum]